MMSIKGAIAVALIGVTPATAQQNIDAQKAALKEIRETAADICYTVEQRGRKSEAQLTGEVQAKVTGAIAKLADLGIKGSGQVGSMEYEGVSQEALGTALAASVNCRERVFDKLIDKMLPSGGSEAAVRQSNPTRRPTAQTPPTPNQKKISIGAFSIGDTIEQVRSSGIQGQFGVSKDGYSQFMMLIAVPIGDPRHFSINKNGQVTYIFHNKAIDIITVFIMDRGSCDAVNFMNVSWSKFLLSQTIQELGEPIEAPTQHKETFPIQGQPFSADVTQYIFSGNGENRMIQIADATGANNWGQKACLYVSTHVKEG